MILQTVRKLIGVALIFNGVCVAGAPEAYVRRFQCGPPLLDDLLEYTAENPRWVVSLGLSEVALGLWLTLS